MTETSFNNLKQRNTEWSAPRVIGRRFERGKDRFCAILAQVSSLDSLILLIMSRGLWHARKRNHCRNRRRWRTRNLIWDLIPDAFDKELFGDEPELDKTDLYDCLLVPWEWTPVHSSFKSNKGLSVKHSNPPDFLKLTFVIDLKFGFVILFIVINKNFTVAFNRQFLSF